jgi:Ser/Thr protein kinase RdoA (MazF antagonist)
MEARYRAFDAALAEDRESRAAGVAREIGFMLDNRERGSVLIRALREGRIPERICHNDAKIGNILFDAEANTEPAPGATPCPDTGGPGAGGKALCLVDLDTVMPGTPLFDLGDLIRTVPALTEEDDPDLSAAGIDLPRYEALLEGYLSEASSFLTAAERDLLAESGRNLTQIMGLRFLTDYLDGDRYYRRTRPGHNLDRCRNQIALIEAMDASWAELEAIVSCIADC